MRSQTELGGAWLDDDPTNAARPDVGDATGYEVLALQSDNTLVFAVIVPKPPDDYATVPYLLGVNPYTGRPAWRIVDPDMVLNGFGTAFGGGFGES